MEFYCPLVGKQVAYASMVKAHLSSRDTTLYSLCRPSVAYSLYLDPRLRPSTPSPSLRCSASMQFPTSSPLPSPLHPHVCSKPKKALVLPNALPTEPLKKHCRDAVLDTATWSRVQRQTHASFRRLQCHRQLVQPTECKCRLRLCAYDYISLECTAYVVQ